MLKNSASQSVALFAFDITTGAAKTGDALNMVFYVTKDFGSVTAIASNSGVPSEMDSTNAKGWYKIALSQAETNADNLLFSGKSSTANISIVGRPVDTDPALYTTLLIDGNGRVDVIKIAGTTQTARDIGASVLLSTGSGTGQLDFTSGVVKANATQILGGTIPTPNVTGVPIADLKYVLGTAITESGAGRDAASLTKFLDVASPSFTAADVNQTGDSFARIGANGSGLTGVTGVTLAAAQKVDVDTIKTNPVVNGGTITFPTNKTLASTDNITAAVGITVATNNDKTGYTASTVSDKTGYSLAGATAITSNVKQNQALTHFPFLMTDSTNHAPSTGLSVTCTRSIDGGAFGAGTLANVTEVANGIYTVDFGAGDLNGKCIILRATAALSDDRLERIITQV